jgi:IS1 family transposase
MTNVWLKIRVWTKSLLGIALLGYLLAFIFANSGKTVRFWWFFRQEPETSLLFFTLFTFLFGVIVTLLVRAFFKTMRQIRELREKNRVARLERENADMRTKASMLKTRDAAAGPPDVTGP